jgi:NAD(P)H-dependent FMN reductase
MRVLGIAGSLREASHNRSLLRAAADELPPGVELITFDGLKAVEPFDETDEHETGGGMPGADRFIAALRDADAVLFVTPEYNGSIPGVLKNAVDWASRPTPATSALANKPVAVIGASTGMFGAVWAQAELRKGPGPRRRPRPRSRARSPDRSRSLHRRRTPRPRRHPPAPPKHARRPHRGSRAYDQSRGTRERPASLHITVQMRLDPGHPVPWIR